MKALNAVVLALTCIAPCWAQLPDSNLDIALALQAKQQLLQYHYTITTTPAAQTAKEVFSQLLKTTPVQLSGLPFTWDITVLSGGGINAFSTAGGQVYVLDGLAQILAERKALWATAIGHELAHTARRHQVAAYMRAYEAALAYEQQKAHYQARAAQGDESANWALLGLEIGKVVGDLVSLKLSREDEHDADRVGMLMMAEAGYHPAYVFVLHRTLKAYLGDQSKFGAFFSDHPRWETRAQRSHQAYREAVARFESRWPDPWLSLGGVPPPIVFLGKPVASEDKNEGIAIIRIPLKIEEGTGRDLTALAILLDKDGRIATNLPEYRDKSGLFLAQQPSQVTAPSISSQLVFRIPTTALPTPGSAWVNCSTLRELKVFASPAVNDTVVATLTCGEPVALIGQDGSWARVRTKDNKEGYASAWFISQTKTSISRKHELKSQVCVIAPDDGLLLDCTPEFKVKFPKLKGQKK